jgi:hypothetical protein
MTTVELLALRGVLADRQRSLLDRQSDDNPPHHLIFRRGGGRRQGGQERAQERVEQAFQTRQRPSQAQRGGPKAWATPGLAGAARP